MPTPRFKLRNITPNMMSLLKEKASKQKTSVNSLILQIIEQHLGIYHDLDALAGTWSDEDKKEFDKNTRSFSSIDERV